MTTPRTSGPVTFARLESGRGRSLEKLSLRATVFSMFLFCAAAVIASPAQGTFYRTLNSFDGTDGGAFPAGVSLVQATDGNFYGITESGGAYNNSMFCQGGCGTVFKVTPQGALTTLYSFCAQSNCTDGAVPFGGLALGRDGNLYGTTTVGGAYNCNSHRCGTVFKITTGGSLATLYSFCSQSNCADGSYPLAGLVQGSDGNFYGTTYEGGSDDFCPLDGCGTVFVITPGGTLTTLYRFCPQMGCLDGANPIAGLVQGNDGNFYGTSQASLGTVFKMTPQGTLTTLYSFSGLDGAYPRGVLVQGSDGNFYGTTEAGGGGGLGICSEYGCGTVFRITSAGTLTTLHSFAYSDGASPVARLAQTADGNFYGATDNGGAYTFGTLFKITPAGTLTTLYVFQGYPTDGAGPDSGLAPGSNGFFYGTTGGGGSYDSGTVYIFGVVSTCAECRPVTDRLDPSRTRH